MSHEFETIGKETKTKRVYLKGCHTGGRSYYTIQCYMKKKGEDGIIMFREAWHKDYEGQSEEEINKIFEDLTSNMKVKAEIIH